MAFKKAVKGTILAGGGALATVLGLSQFAHYRRKQVSNGTCVDYNMKLKSVKELYMGCVYSNAFIEKLVSRLDLKDTNLEYCLSDP